MMSIDEAISKYRNRVEQYKDFENMKDIAEEHKQLAEWLGLLKWYEQGMEYIPSESGLLPKDVYSAGYIKAIDKCLEIVKFHRNMYDGIEWAIRDIEELKAGAVNE